MILKTYQKYLIKEFLFFILKVTFVFFILGFIMGILEELKFFSNVEIDFYFPFLLVLLNIPALIYQIFPFIILISVIFLFQSLADKGELISFKNHGLENFEIVKLLSLVSFFIGILIVVIFYNFAAILKFNYLDIKKILQPMRSIWPQLQKMVFGLRMKWIIKLFLSMQKRLNLTT